MPVISTRVAVAAAVTLIVDPIRGGVPDPISAVIKNAGAVSCFLGGIAVTAATGYELMPGEPFNADLVAGDVLYAITAGGATTLHVIRFRQ